MVATAFRTLPPEIIRAGGAMPASRREASQTAMVMWKSQNDRSSGNLNPPSGSGTPEPATAPAPAREPAPVPPPPPPPLRTDAPVTHISKTVVLRGAIAGTENLFVDGRVEGTIDLPASIVTIGVNGQIEASVSAKELIILGKMKGDVVSAERVEIRAQGALTGDVSAVRISIEDGAFFKGSIDIKKEAGKSASKQG